MTTNLNSTYKRTHILDGFGRIILTVFVLTTQISCSVATLTNQREEQMNHSISPVKVSAVVKNINNNPLLFITYENISDKDLYFLPDTLTGILIDVSSGSSLDDISPSIKRAAYTIDDYVKVKPNKSTTLEFNLNYYYRFKEGTNSYVFRLGQNYYGPEATENLPDNFKDINFSWTVSDE